MDDKTNWLNIMLCSPKLMVFIVLAKGCGGAAIVYVSFGIFQNFCHMKCKLSMVRFLEKELFTIPFASFVGKVESHEVQSHLILSDKLGPYFILPSQCFCHLSIYFLGHG